MHTTLLVSVRPWTEILLISVLWKMGTGAYHCSPASEVTKCACPTPEWGHAGLCQQLPGTTTPGRGVAHGRDVLLASWASRSPHVPATLEKVRIWW